MNKKTLVRNIYVLCCHLSDEGVPYGKAREIIYKALNDDFSFIGLLPKHIGEDFLSLHQHIQEFLEILSEDDKRLIVNNVLKELYLMVQYLEKIEKEKSLRKRELAKYNSSLKSATIVILLTYLEDGKSFQNEFNVFKVEYKKYASDFIGPLVKLIESKQTEQAESLLIERKAEAYKIASKYSFIDEVDMRTVYEDDEVYNRTIISMTEEELKAFNMDMSVAV